ncbi:hypothetical protein PA01_18575 [Azoarcus sp. PA01]|nr:hypothetical protein PA01_18575 [Azoarcus sp. PA01]
MAISKSAFLSNHDALRYLASYDDLILAFGANVDAARDHYFNHGIAEGRTITFDGLKYIASYGDLSAAFGTNAEAGVAHYVNYGYAEGRTATFDDLAGLAYIASYPDLIAAFGADAGAGIRHYFDYGRAEGRSITFDPEFYLAKYDDLRGAFGDNLEAATLHYIQMGFAEQRVTSKAGNDVLVGSALANHLNGGPGDDVLRGDWGNDLLTGGPGADRFEFTTPPQAALNLDYITDFNVADDTLVLDNAVFVALGGTGPVSSGMLHVGPGATTALDANDHLIYDSASGALYYDVDGSGDSSAVQFAALAPGLALTAGDFWVS